VRTYRYQIIISGALGELGREAFADLRMENANGNTMLIGDLDQAALYNALNRILALGLELVALNRLSEAPA
jgi:hypothetical protein